MAWRAPPEDAARELVVLWCDRLEIRERVNFSFGSAHVEPSSLALLDEIARVLIAHPEIARLTIVGHTDDRGDEAYNQALSLARAEAVRARLMDNGVNGWRLRAVGHGERDPLVGDGSEAGRAADRRVEFLITERD